MADYTHFNYMERQQLACLLRLGNSISTIAKRMGRHRSSLYRELSRNSVNNIYSPSGATTAAKNRHYVPPNKLDSNQSLRDYVKDKLERGWTPEQIAGRMKKDNEPFYSCPESIYRYLYNNRCNYWYQHLPKRHPRRRKRTLQKPTKKALDIASRNIKHRPEQVLMRNELGHWEGDTIRFKQGQRSCVTTLVERKSRYLKIRKNSDGRTNTVIGHIKKIIRSMPKNSWQSLTLDQGCEFRNFYELLRKTKSDVYFCDTHSPWQRGSNENMNGRLRRYLPLTANIDQLNDEEIQMIENRLNNIPRKCLNYQTPQEVFMQNSKPPCRTSL